MSRQDEAIVGSGRELERLDAWSLGQNKKKVSISHQRQSREMDWEQHLSIQYYSTITIYALVELKILCLGLSVNSAGWDLETGFRTANS